MSETRKPPRSFVSVKSIDASQEESPVRSSFVTQHPPETTSVKTQIPASPSPINTVPTAQPEEVSDGHAQESAVQDSVPNLLLLRHAEANFGNHETRELEASVKTVHAPPVPRPYSLTGSEHHEPSGSAKNATNLAMAKVKPPTHTPAPADTTPSAQGKSGQLVSISGYVKKNLPNSIGAAGTLQGGKQLKVSVREYTDEFEIPYSPMKRPSTKRLRVKKSAAADDDDYREPTKPNGTSTQVARALRSRKLGVGSHKSVSANEAPSVQTLNVTQSETIHNDKRASKESTKTLQESVEEFEDLVTTVNDHGTTKSETGSMPMEPHNGKLRSKQPVQHQNPRVPTGVKNTSKAERDLECGARNESQHGATQELPIELGDSEQSEDESVVSGSEQIPDSVYQGHSDQEAASRAPSQHHSSPPAPKLQTSEKDNTVSSVQTYTSRQPAIVAKDNARNSLVEDYTSHKPIIVHFSQSGPKNQGGILGNEATKSPALPKQPRNAAKISRQEASIETEANTLPIVDTDPRGKGTEKISHGAALLEAMLPRKGGSNKLNQQQTNKSRETRDHGTFLEQNAFTIAGNQFTPKRSPLKKEIKAQMIVMAPTSTTRAVKRVGQPTAGSSSKRAKADSDQKQVQTKHPIKTAADSPALPEIFQSALQPRRRDDASSDVSPFRVKPAILAQQEQTVFTKPTSRPRISAVTHSTYPKGTETDMTNTRVTKISAKKPKITSSDQKQERTATVSVDRTKQILLGPRDERTGGPKMQRLDAATPLTLPKRINVGSAEERSNQAILAMPTKKQQDNFVISGTRPNVGKSKTQSSTASKLPTARAAPVRVTSLSTVDVNGSPVPDGVAISGNSTVLETFSQQQQQDNENDIEVALLPPYENYFGSLPIVEQQEGQDNNEVRGDKELLCSKQGLDSVSSDANPKVISVTRASNSRQSGLLQTPRGPSRTNTFADDDGDENGDEEEGTIEFPKTTSTYVENLKQQFAALNGNDAEYPHRDGGADDEEMEEDLERTLVNEGYERYAEAANDCDETLSSSPSYVPADETKLVMNAGDPLAVWRAALEPHQGSLFDQLVQIAHRLVSHLIDKETAISDIIDDYQASGLKLIENMEEQHSAQIAHYLNVASSTSKKLAKGYKQTEEHLRKDLKDVEHGVEELCSQRLANGEKMHERLERMLRQCA
ncbi:hypothetical protein MBLNU459_g3790t2 [Dothideomycetes sp. NU459]